jgi:hypothetical protein
MGTVGMAGISKVLMFIIMSLRAFRVALILPYRIGIFIHIYGVITSESTLKGPTRPQGLNDGGPEF